MPGIASMDIETFLDDFCETSPAQAILAIRAAVLVCLFAPMITVGQLAFLTSLPPSDREKALEKLLYHPNYFLRQIVAVLKGIGALLYAADPAVQIRMTGRPPRNLIGIGRRRLT